MTLGDLLREIHQAGLTLTATEGEDVLGVYPASNITPELSATIREHKPTLVRVTLEDERFKETGIVQSERQVFGLAREYFGLDKEAGAP